MRLVIIAPPDFAPLPALRSSMRGIDVIVSADPAELRRALDGADAVLVAPRSGALLAEVAEDAARVRWIHALAAGVETLPFAELRKTGVVVTNSRGLYAEALAEFAIAAMLWFAKDLRRLIRNQAAAKWEMYTVERLEGRTAGIVGYGGIGRAVGRLTTALGMNLVTVSRSEGDLDQVSAVADYLVIAAPLTPQTRGMIDATRLARMKRDAVLINVGRGAVVDEAALIGALREKRLRGAALDVFEVEPLPPEHPLWSLDNVLISPHTADHTADSHDRAIAFFLQNLRRFSSREPLENAVDKSAEY